MRIAFYMPFKPLGHGRPSGDLHIGRTLRRWLLERGHEIIDASALRTRWITHRPWLWPAAALELARLPRLLRRTPPDLWLTYHAYYKAPDVLGPHVSRKLGIPYAIYQAAYSTKRRKRAGTWAGFHLNRRALLAADLVAANKRRDFEQLGRIVPAERLALVRQGIHPGDFTRDPEAGKTLRAEWAAPDTASVILAVAMFRSDVKTRGLEFLIRACGQLAGTGRDFRLVLAGDGPGRERLRQLAEREIPGRARFLGKVEGQHLRRVYSAADLYAFPGINEALGLAYLEAQAAGLPVVAFDGWGVPEAVASGETGLLTEPFDLDAFAATLARLLDEPETRLAMGIRGSERVSREFDLQANLARFEELLYDLAG
ncbi:glycosyltransferase family 4 protein [Desulfohalovibrio reitneri]|uniref:glycosyltransferase family 4 protein n=1 Tax=Desulfohalovibrio reitneri TaxID=1307759 RepID=UPI0004A726A9|nr:glycosyltransferase family 4 protein [Desulfohalovibrio reitneri]